VVVSTHVWVECDFMNSIMLAVSLSSLKSIGSLSLAFPAQNLSVGNP